MLPLPPGPRPAENMKTQKRRRLGVIGVCGCPCLQADSGRENVFVWLRRDALPNTVVLYGQLWCSGFLFLFLIHIILFS